MGQEGALRSSLKAVRASSSLLAGIAAAGPVGAQTLPNGFAFENRVLEPFVTNPVGFAFLPDGRILLIEKDSGNVRLAVAGSTASTSIATVPGVRGGGERGLLGVAVDPDWPLRPYIYFHATHEDSTVHVTRLTASGDLDDSGSDQVALGNPYLVYKGVRDVYEHHNGGTLRFGPDGHLYVSAGDDGVACDAQDVNRANGKILRLRVATLPGSGSGPPPLAEITPLDNPFSGPTETARLVFAFGLRNPFRFTIDPPTAALYIGDVGLLAWEEVDELTTAEAGSNYGWPALEGFDPPPCCAECSRFPPFTDPIYLYPNPTDPDVSVSVVGGPRYRRDPTSSGSFPFQYVGDLFIADFYSGWIRRLKRQGNSWDIAPSVPGQPSAENWAEGIRFITDLQLGPEGALYCLTMIGSGVPRGLHRIVDLTTTDTATAKANASWLVVPNPSRRGAMLTLRHPLAGSPGTRVRIVDALGRRVRTLRLSEGSAAMQWDGRDAQGNLVPSGIYWVQLEAPGGELGRVKFTLLE